MSLNTTLTQLETAQLVRRVDDPLAVLAELAYQFKHALTQDAAYALLLKHDRVRLHRMTAQAYETFYADLLDENAPILAHHYGEAGDDAKTLEYATRAGDAAARRFANAEARLYYGEALQALAQLPDNATHRRIHIDAILRFVSVSLRSEGPHKSLTRLLEAEAIAKELYGAAPETREDRLHLARIRYWIAQAYLHGNQPRQAIRYLQDVLSVAQAEGDEELQAIPESMLGRALAVQGKFADAEPHLRAATRMLDGDATNHEAVMARGMLGWVLAERGDYTGGIVEGERARVMAAQAGSLTGLGLSGMTLCLIALAGGDYSRSMEESQDMIRVAERAGDHLLIYVGYGTRAWAENQLGNYVAAYESMARTRQLGGQAGGRLTFADAFDAVTAEVALNAGRADEALAHAEQTVLSAQTMEDNYAQGLAHRVWATALVAVDPPHYDQSELHFAESLRFFEAGDARLQAARTHAAWGKMLRKCGNESAAREHFVRAAAQFEKSGLERELKETRQLTSNT